MYIFQTVPDCSLHKTTFSEVYNQNLYYYSNPFISCVNGVYISWAHTEVVGRDLLLCLASPLHVLHMGEVFCFALPSLCIRDITTREDWGPDHHFSSRQILKFFQTNFEILGVW